MRLAGIDLAWQGGINTSAVAVGRLDADILYVEQVYPDRHGNDDIVAALSKPAPVTGVAIDAPTIINNASGQRPCEKVLASVYAGRHAGCHPTNRSLYPDARSVALAHALQAQGYEHAAEPSVCRWQIECYPHPALIEIFGLERRLGYKKGRVIDKRTGQSQLAGLIARLGDSSVLALKIPLAISDYLDATRIHSLKGRLLKQNEDVLDAIVCLYIAGLYASCVTHALFGSPEEGYIYVPRVCCITGQ